MQTSFSFRLDLRKLILALAILSGIVTLANSLYASYRVQRQMLIDHTLESNHAYAAKLAGSIDDFLIAAQQQLYYSAKILAKHYNDTDYLLEEANRLRQQTNSFNSVVIANAQGIVLATSPDTLQIVGKKLTSVGATQALRERKPLISATYMSVVGNLLVFISQPVYDGSGIYLGYIGGTIYLKEKSILHSLLGEHYHRDGSYLYVIDANRRILYHPKIERIGTLVSKNPAIDAVISGRTGDMHLSNSEGIDMLAGYAYVKTANWGVVAQRPTAAALAKLDSLMLDVLRNTMPLGLVTAVFIWLFSRLIAKPLWRLAESAKDMELPGTASRIDKIYCWYFESAQIKSAMLLGINLMHGTIGKLNSDVKTDPLTGLHNRRELTSTLEAWTREQRFFSVIALDIDHFKRVNDTYGHDIGDHVLQTLAQLMREASRADDVLCRVGGEEFLVLLSNTSLHTAAQVAERLRASVENHPIEPVGHITISLGVAHCPQDGVLRADQVLKQADDLLYQAKNKGRNRVEVAGP